MKKLTKAQELLAKPCTPLQIRVVTGVISGLSQREAYLKAGGTAKTETSQDSAVSKMMSNDKVAAFYASLISKPISKAIMTREEALERLTKSAKVTITDVCDFKEINIGTAKKPCHRFQWVIKDFKDIDPGIAASIKSITMTSNGPKLELYDSHGAIKQMAEMQGWNTAKKHEIEAEVTITKIIREII